MTVAYKCFSHSLMIYLDLGSQLFGRLMEVGMGIEVENRKIPMRNGCEMCMSAEPRAACRQICKGAPDIAVVTNLCCHCDEFFRDTSQHRVHSSSCRTTR